MALIFSVLQTFRSASETILAQCSGRFRKIEEKGLRQIREIMYRKKVLTYT